jgi:hypothetical protein
MIIAQSSSTSLISWYAKATHSLQVSQTFSFSLYYTIKTNILNLCPQELNKMKITTSNNGVWTDFIYCTDDRCFKNELHSF